MNTHKKKNERIIPVFDSSKPSQQHGMTIVLLVLLDSAIFPSRRWFLPQYIPMCLDCRLEAWTYAGRSIAFASLLLTFTRNGSGLFWSVPRSEQHRSRFFHCMHVCWFLVILNATKKNNNKYTPRTTNTPIGSLHAFQAHILSGLVSHWESGLFYW